MAQARDVFFCGHLCVRFATAIAILFVDEQHKPQRSPWLVPHGFQRSKGLDGMNDPRTVVVRSLSNVPGIQMPSQGDDFMIELRASPLPNDVALHDLATFTAIQFEFDHHRLTSLFCQSKSSSQS